MNLKASLSWKIRSSESVIKSSQKKFGDKLAIAWSGGKDSTVLLHMIRSLNNNQIPHPVMFIDTGLHFAETYEFITRLAKEWKFNLIRIYDKSGIRRYRESKSHIKRTQILRKTKINCIKNAIRQHKWKSLNVGIRWDEHQARSSETYFSIRNTHLRVHPILHFSEQDIWNYTRYFHLPYNPLYDNGYRSIGERTLTKPVLDPKLKERAGRRYEKPKDMEHLRVLGYF